ncbi:MAG TPA: class I SAM-dependent methyltransferase [Solirubrobacteraceae bacterium]|nr:class I SAM-dependent methyltransferase [Solirubrobacteraceae bacterium]
MGTAETAGPLRRGTRELSSRYAPADLGVFTEEERRRFLRGGHDPTADIELAWELLYRLEPRIYARLVGAERLHPDLVAWLPEELERIVEVGAGSGRLTVQLAARGRSVYAIEPAAPLRELLSEELARTPLGDRVRVIDGFFDSLPVADGSAELVVACSAFTPDPAHGGDRGLAEMERVCRPGGTVAIVWPNNLDWLAARGYRHLSFPGAMWLEFASPEEAVELVEVFHPQAAARVRDEGLARVTYETVGINPPRDVAFRVMPA